MVTIAATTTNVITDPVWFAMIHLKSMTERMMPTDPVDPVRFFPIVTVHRILELRLIPTICLRRVYRLPVMKIGTSLLCRIMLAQYSIPQLILNTSRGNLPECPLILYTFVIREVPPQKTVTGSRYMLLTATNVPRFHVQVAFLTVLWHQHGFIVTINMLIP